MEKRKEHYIVVLCAIIAITFACIIVIADYNASTWTKTYRLNEQFIASIHPSHNGTSDLTPCDDCLFMKVQDEWWTPSGLMTQNLTFFFANEHQLRGDLQPRDMIEVRWKWVDGNRCIRGVQKVNE